MRPWALALSGSRVLRRIVISRGISLVGSRATAFALPVIAVDKLGGGPLIAAAILGVTFGAEAVVSPYAGVLADRLRPVPLLVAGEVGAAASVLLLAVLSFAGHLEAHHLMAAAALIGACTALFEAAVQAVVPAICPDPTSRSGVNSLLELAQSVSSVLGPPAAGLLIGAFEPGYVFAIDALTYGVSVVLLVGVWAPSLAGHHVSATQQPRTLALLAGFRHVWRDLDLRTALLGSSLLNLGGAVMGGVAVVFVLDEIGMSPTTFGVAGALGSASAVIGAIVAPHLIRTASDYRIAAVSGLALGLSLWLLPSLDVVPHLGVLISYEMSFGFAAALFAVSLATLRQRLAHEAIQGRVFSVFRSLNSITTLVGLLTGGLWAGYVSSLSTTLAIGAGIAILGSLQMARLLARRPPTELHDEQPLHWRA